MPHPLRMARKAAFIPLEDDEHIALADWLRANLIFFHHSPNGGVRPSRTDAKGARFSNEGKKLQRMGTIKGFPDFLVIDPPPPFTEGPPVAVELKRVKGGKPSPEQLDLMAELEKRGWTCYLAKGADAAITFLKSLGYGRKEIRNV
ncbi:VRR-NUC domain-containing protein [Gammaproteobacteria bacterium]